MDLTAKPPSHLSAEEERLHGNTLTAPSAGGRDAHRARSNTLRVREQDERVNIHRLGELRLRGSWRKDTGSAWPETGQLKQKGKVTAGGWRDAHV